MNADENVFLHLGLAKTGTSWFQKKLFPLLDLCFYHVGHYDIIDKPVAGKTLFSFEGLSGTPYNGDRYLLAQRLHDLFPYAKILVMFRDQESYITSLYGQYIRGGGTESLEWFHGYLSGCDGFLCWKKYRDYLRYLWGEESCWFPWFEDFCHNPQVFTHQVCDWMGVDVPKHIDFSPVNRGLSTGQKKRWMRINRFFRSRWNTDGLFPRLLNPCYIFKVVNER